MKTSIFLMCTGVALVQIGFWVVNSTWVSLGGAALMFYAMFHTFKDED